MRVDRRSSWSRERTETLIRMAAAGASGSAIANVLRTTRSAVLGRAWRLKIKLKGNSGDRLGAPRPARKPQRHDRTSSTGKLVKKPAVWRPCPALTWRAPSSPASAPLGPPVSFIDLTDQQCRWPVEGGFCGQVALYRGPYCSYHARIGGRKYSG